MAQENTVRRLADFTDEGAFERLATAILRRSDDRFRSLSHPGVNADGKTVKSPVDGIAFVPGAVPPQMIAVHHTTCAAKDLEKKWLHDPAGVKPRGKNKLPTARPGDVIKTIEIVVEERQRTPNVEATLILTTNQEPGEKLVRDVHAAGRAAGIAIDIWARSRLADALDNKPWGQWLRRQFLGIDQVLLSADLLRELSIKNMEDYRPFDRPEAWVERDLDRKIEDTGEEEIVFVIGESGSGKSVACYKRLLANASTGGFSLILPDEVISSSLSLEQAVEKSLMQVHPSLIAGCGSTALQMSNPARRLLLAVEDINKSGRAATLVEKIARWQGDKSKAADATSWQLLCPVWPRVMASLSDNARKRINIRAVAGTVFSEEEGAEAVERRCALDRRQVTKLEASRISKSLGHDPLLIALYDPAHAPDASETISHFIEIRIQGLTESKGEFTAAEYNKAITDLARNMLLNRQIEPGSIELFAWPALAGHASALRHLVYRGDIIRLAGPSADEKLAFRHDRVREWLLARAASDLIQANAMPSDIAAEPYFAEIFALALTRQDASTNHISLMALHNPLALFCSVRHFGTSPSVNQKAIVAALETWLSRASGNAVQERCLRWEAMRALADAEGPYVSPLVARFEDNSSWDALRARYRNGDLMGGIGLCLRIEPGLKVAGHQAFLDHVKARFGAGLVRALAGLLNNADLEEPIRIGALRLAGHLGEPALANAIRACWHSHENRGVHLDEYLWACAQCIDDDPQSLLGPVCDGWAALPKATGQNGMASPRDNLAADHLRWAFRTRLPVRAIRYFIQRAADPDLKWPITYMLHGLDQPDALEFVVRELATTNGFSPFALIASRDWEHPEEANGRAMSDASRKRLQDIWQDQSAGKYLRRNAFRFWAATRHVSDIEILRAVPAADELADNALWQRLRLRDRGAIPAMIAKLPADHTGYWWQLGRYIWSDELTKALDEALDRRGAALSAAGLDAIKRADADWILSEMIMRLPVGEADALLNKHWDHVSASHYYVIAALYTATPGLKARAAATIEMAPNPKELLKYLSMRFGHRQSGHPGVRRPEQIMAVLPYLDLLEPLDIHDLWSACSEHGWFALRRAHLDSRYPPTMREWVYLDEARVMNALDKFLEDNDPWIEHWLDDFLKSGASLDDVMAILGRWLSGKSDIQALKVACNAVLHIGERRHLELLRAVKMEPSDLVAAIVADTELAVKRRTLRA